MAEDTGLPRSRSPLLSVPTAGTVSSGSECPMPEVGSVGRETVSGSTSSGTFDDAGSVVSDSNPVLAQVAVLLKSQADALTAQTKAVSLQNLPPLPMYNGENMEITDDGFELWCKIF